jgi:hypothetical protein
MAASDRDAVKPSHPRQAAARTHIQQSPVRVAATKTSATSAGRDAVRQSPRNK